MSNTTTTTTTEIAGDTVPSYCQVLRYKDANGQVKEMIFPKALDLDRPKRPRTTFSETQLACLEKEFHRNPYLIGKDRTRLASTLGLSETQIKIWYQNRRTKHKKLQTPKSKTETTSYTESAGGEDWDVGDSSDNDDKQSVEIRTKGPLTASPNSESVANAPMRHPLYNDNLLSAPTSHQPGLMMDLKLHDFRHSPFSLEPKAFELKTHRIASSLGPQSFLQHPMLEPGFCSMFPQLTSVSGLEPTSRSSAANLPVLTSSLMAAANGHWSTPGFCWPTFADGSATSAIKPINIL